MKTGQTKHKKQISTGEKIINAASYVIFTVFTLLCLFPFYYLMICTISDNALVEYGQITFWPRGIHFDNYVDVFQVQNLMNSVKITVLRTIVGTVAGVGATSYMAYFFTKTEMWGRKFWYRFCVITMYFSSGLIPSYLTNRMLGLNNTFWIYIIPGCISVYNMILIKTSIEAMPPSLEESAYLDGAGFLTRYLRIVLPLQKPILATITLFVAVSHWNDFFTTKIYVTNPKLYTMQFLLYELLNNIQTAVGQMGTEDRDAYISPAGTRMTLTAVVIIPIMCVYPFIQKYFVKGIMIGAVKG
ncbi:MAG TPA: carbohydrate ABC transporter permease [Candidatus Eisenbergiella merdipullorum]|uniref:Carbohydrate ABC transporter permease n=1 Tax=Candidatus Eisenbergiella merdipullorum TaxID=2838553 RepID=A0A9D2I6S9_9FIRM|nr:carbohydrate ABC transporter permease [Candidatus Eisenbergiella merdipullorum]